MNGHSFTPGLGPGDPLLLGSWEGILVVKAVLYNAALRCPLTKVFNPYNFRTVLVNIGPETCTY
jgi:hypothetical protein